LPSSVAGSTGTETRDTPAAANTPADVQVVPFKLFSISNRVTESVVDHETTTSRPLAESDALAFDIPAHALTGAIVVVVVGGSVVVVVVVVVVGGGSVVVVVVVVDVVLGGTTIGDMVDVVVVVVGATVVGVGRVVVVVAGGKVVVEVVVVPDATSGIGSDGETDRA